MVVPSAVRTVSRRGSNHNSSLAADANDWSTKLQLAPLSTRIGRVQVKASIDPLNVTNSAMSRSSLFLEEIWQQRDNKGVMDEARGSLDGGGDNGGGGGGGGWCLSGPNFGDRERNAEAGKSIDETFEPVNIFFHLVMLTLDLR